MGPFSDMSTMPFEDAGAVTVVTLLLLCTLGPFGCTKEKPSKPIAPSQPTSVVIPFDSAVRVDLRDRARLVVEEHCGLCHIPGLNTSIDAALRVFDLHEEEWARRMDAPQLRDVSFRLSQGLGPEGADGASVDVSDTDRNVVADYIDAELAQRQLRSQGPDE